MLQLSMNDVLAVVSNCVPYFIGLAVALVLLVIVMIAVCKQLRC